RSCHIIAFRQMLIDLVPYVRTYEYELRSGGVGRHLHAKCGTVGTAARKGAGALKNTELDVRCVDRLVARQVDYVVPARLPRGTAPLVVYPPLHVNLLTGLNRRRRRDLCNDEVRRRC